MKRSLFRSKPSGLLRHLFRLPIALYRHNLGWLLGHRFLLLIHRGRRSGQIRQTVLEVVGYDPATRVAVVVSAWGTRADWYRNIQASPPIEVRIGRVRYAPAYRVLDQDEAFAFYSNWERKHPVEAWILPKLLRIEYDGSDAARQRLLEQVRLVVFRPKDELGAGRA